MTGVEDVNGYVDSFVSESKSAEGVGICEFYGIERIYRVIMAAGRLQKRRQLNPPGKEGYPFWDWFLKIGRKNLNEYNRSNGTNVRIIQERNFRSTHTNSLLLYLLQIIKRDEVAKKRPVNMKIVKELLVIGELGGYDAVVLANRINTDLSKWKGLSMDALTIERSDATLKKFNIFECYEIFRE